LLVEAVALVVARDAPLRLGALAGLAIGTFGLAAEWAWSHVWMPNPWKASLVPEAIVWVPLTAVAAGVLGALVGRALAGEPVAIRPVPAWPGSLAGAVVVAALWWPLPTDDGGGIRAAVSLRELTPAPERTVEATLRLDPHDAADGNDYFTLTAWQGAGWSRQQVVIDELVPAGPNEWRTTEPIPVHGEWKAIARLHDGRTLAALPIFLPEDAAIPAPEVPAEAAFTRTFVADKEILQREFTGGAAWLTTLAYAVLAAIAIGWIALVAWGLGRFLRDRPVAAVAGGRGRVVGAPVTVRTG
jgi:hypothetical protein